MLSSQQSPLATKSTAYTVAVRVPPVKDPATHRRGPHHRKKLKGLVGRAEDGIADAGKKTNSAPTRFAAAYSAAFWLARAALEACGYRPAGSEGHRVVPSAVPRIYWRTCVTSRNFARQSRAPPDFSAIFGNYLYRCGIASL